MYRLLDRTTMAPSWALPSTSIVRMGIERADGADSVDERIRGMIERAKRDYLLRPFPGQPGLLSFRRAMRVPPNDIYLVFVLSTNPYDAEVYYRVGLEDGHLLWKCGAETY